MQAIQLRHLDRYEVWERYEQQARDSIRDELEKDDHEFAALTEFYAVSVHNVLEYLACAARGNHNAEKAKSMKGAFIAEIVEAKWKDRAKSMYDADMTLGDERDDEPFRDVA